MKDELERYLLKDPDINRILEIVKDLDLLQVIQSPRLVNDELLLLRGALRDYRKNLSNEQLANYEKLISGQSFNGRKNMLRDLQEHLKDF
ncbi:TPA: hypothetical protein ACHVGM_000331 [Streptococcus suis]